MGRALSDARGVKGSNMETQDDLKFIKRTIELAKKNLTTNDGGPFGALITKNGEIIAEGWNTVTSSNDPTSHAEVNAIRKACKTLNSFQLDDCTLYTSCEPCPMCLGAIYWARPSRIVFAASREDAAFGGFDDEWLYQEIAAPTKKRKIETVQITDPEARKLFQLWKEKVDKTPY